MDGEVLSAVPLHERRILHVTAVDPGAFTDIVDREGEAGAVGGVVGIGAVDCHTGEEHTAAAGNCELNNVFFVDVIDCERIESLHPFPSVL